MLIGNNYSIIRKLSNRNLKEHKVRNTMLILVIMSLTVLVTVLYILSDSTFNNMECYYLQQYGISSHVQITDVTEEELGKITNFKEVEDCGVSNLLGNAINSEFGDRPTSVRYADMSYVEYTFGLPEQGRLPKSVEEVAVDTTVLEDLGIQNQLGETIELQWCDERGIDQRSNLKIVGIWEGNNICANRNIWVSEKLAQGQKNTITDVALNFRKDKHVAESLEKMVDELSLNANVTLNWVYDDNMQRSIFMETLAFRMGIALVLICGFLIIYNIIQISITTDIKLYGRMKTIGASSSQIRFAVFRQIHILSIIGIVFGLLIGYGVATGLVPVIIDNIDITIMVYTNAMDFVLTAVLVYAVVVISGIRPAWFASSVNPSDLLSEENSLNFCSKSHRRTPGFPALFQLSISNIGRYKKRNILVILLLTVGLISLSCVYVVDTSFDIEKYIDEIALSDFTVSEKTLVNSWGEYDPCGNTINEDVLEMLDSTEGIVEKGTLYSQECSISLSDDAYENIIGFYEQNDDEILAYMNQNVAWAEGYKNLKQTKTCMATIFGIDGLAKDKITENDRILEGTIDKELFSTGNYAIAQGMSGIQSTNQPTYNVGDSIEISGTTFIIMAVVDAPYPITEGKINPGSEFSLQFFIPTSQFEKLYPGNTPRKLFFNVAEDKKEEVENTIGKAVEDDGLPVVSEKTIADKYNKETKSAFLMQNIVVGMIVIIGIINMVNSIITSVLDRKKEFAMMQSIGMTKKQLSTLLILEGLNTTCIVLIFSYFLSFIAISVGVKAYLESQWTATYHFSIMPLLVITPILIAVSIIIPFLCFRYIQKVEITERLEADEDMSGF